MLEKKSFGSSFLFCGSEALWPTVCPPSYFCLLSVMIVTMNDIEQLFIYVALGVFGAALGSFAGAQVWRLRARQLDEDKADGEPVDAAEFKRLKPLLSKKGAQDRSIDLDTGKQLPWYDMIPVVSWLVLRGKSRFSGKPIGKMEFLLEIGTAAFFIASYMLWQNPLLDPVAIIQFAVWLIAGVGLAILFCYDAKWFLLPDRVSFTVIGLGVIYAVLQVIGSAEPLQTAMSVVSSIAILSGLYLILYVISKGRWIGFGDIKLGLGLGLLLADWRLAFIALFAANLIGTLYVLPGMIRGTLARNAHVPFGPLLILGAIFAQFFGLFIAEFYLGLL